VQFNTDHIYFYILIVIFLALTSRRQLDMTFFREL